MKDLIKNAKIYAIPIVLGIFILVGLINQCSNYKAGDVNNTTETDVLRAYIIDSVQSAEVQISIAEMQAEKEKTAKQTALDKAIVNWYKRKYGAQKDISDSLQSLVPKSDTVCLKAIASKQVEIDCLDSALVECDKEAIGYSKQLYLCENQSNLKDGLLENRTNTIIKLNGDIKALQKINKRNWFERNKMWIGFVIGVVGSGLILR